VTPRLSLLKSVGQEEATREWIVEPEINAQQVVEMVNEQPVVIAGVGAKRVAERDFTRWRHKMQ
jgi:hypothetical protein